MILFSSSFTIGLDLSEAQGFDELKTHGFPVMSSPLHCRSAQPFSEEQYELIAEAANDEIRHLRQTGKV